MTSASQSQHARSQQPPVALVTGAGSGIGRETCILLARQNHRLVVVGRREEHLKATAQAIQESAPTYPRDFLLHLAADISQSDGAKHVIERTVAHFGRLDALVNNAGAVEAVPIERTTQDLLDRMFAVNVFGPAHMMTAAWPIFLSQRSGCVVNVSSMSTIDPFPGLAAYAAAKSALESFTRSIRNEGGHLGIRAFTVAPGSVETAMLRSIASEEDLPRSRTLDPAVVAAVILDCILGNRNRDIGHVIRVPSP
jgi:NAD(P)-dependent dehydrogenase (short-subunit alcohol dehydrogenase family)